MASLVKIVKMDDCHKTGREQNENIKLKKPLVEARMEIELTPHPY